MAIVLWNSLSILEKCLFSVEFVYSCIEVFQHFNYAALELAVVPVRLPAMIAIILLTVVPVTNLVLVVSFPRQVMASIVTPLVRPFGAFVLRASSFKLRASSSVIRVHLDVVNVARIFL